MKSIAVLLTCHNRKEKTITCLDSFFASNLPDEILFDIYLVDDGSTDGTSKAVALKYPKINIIYSEDNLFWAGGMRLAWLNAKKTKIYDGFLLLNDDVELEPHFFETILATHNFSKEKFKEAGLYVSTTKNKDTGDISYGGSKIINKVYNFYSTLIVPRSTPIDCEMTNANILFVHNSVVDKIGILDTYFTHGIADYDYSLTALKNNIPILVCPEFGGYCTDDHGYNWVEKEVSLKKRIAYLYSPKGLAYKEYLFFIKRHFPLALPYSFIILWLKTLFPILWFKFKKA